MNSRASARVAAPSDSRSNPFDAMVELGRDQFAVALETSAAIWRGFEAIRSIQQRAAQAASQRHGIAARQLRKATAPEQLATIPAGLWQRDLESAVHGWQELVAAMLDVQLESLQCACSYAIDAPAALEAASAIDALDVLPRKASARRRATPQH